MASPLSDPTADTTSGAKSTGSPVVAWNESSTLQVLDAIGDMVLVKGPGSRMVWANKAFRDFYGMTNEQLRGAVDAPFNEPDYTLQYVKDDAFVFETGRTLDIPEEHVTRHDGEVFLVHTVKSPIRDAAGNVVMTVGVFRDITNSRLVKRRLKIAERMASIGTLAAGVAHEVNNPLMFIQMNLELCTATLAQDTVSAEDLAEVRAALADIAEGAERVRLIVRDLKTFSAGDSAHDQRIDLRNVVDKATRVAANELKHRARVVVEADGPAFVDGNEAQLGQVFLNLLMNAAQSIVAGDADHNEIRVTLQAATGAGVRAEIRDSGRGIPPENLSRLFDPFFTTKSVGEGTGLGLSIVHNVVAAHHGTIEVESSLGRGSVFRVLLPASVVEPKVVPEPEPTPGSQARSRVLVVDDEPLVLTVVSRVLSRHYDVVTCDSAALALERLAAGERFDVILCDVSMPRMTGDAFFEEVRRTDPRQSERFLFMTGGAFTAEAQLFLDDPSHRRVDKPLQAAVLERAVRKVIDESRAAAARTPAP